MPGVVDDPRLVLASFSGGWSAVGVPHFTQNFAMVWAELTKTIFVPHLLQDLSVRPRTAGRSSTGVALGSAAARAGEA